MIHRIHIDGYKTFNDFQLQLTNLNVLFGPNAAGKSNFLDGLQLLSLIVRSRTLKEAFAPPYRGKAIESFTVPQGGIEGLLEKPSVNLRFSVDIEISEKTAALVDNEIQKMREGIGKKKEKYVKERLLRYELDLEMLPEQGILRVRNESLSALKSDFTINQKRSPFLGKGNDSRLSLRMEGQSRPTLYDIGLDHSILSKSLYPPHYPHITAFKREVESWRFFYFEPRERMRASSPLKDVRHIGMMGEDLAAYMHGLRINQEKRFNSICKSIKVIIPSIEGILTQIDKKTGDVELFIIENGISFSSRLVSEGTLRLLGLLSITGDDDTPSVICFEEPENGIHPRRIRILSDYLRNISDETQVIVTTHSPIFPDGVDNNNLFVCKKISGFTSIKRFDEMELFRQSEINKNLDDEAPLPSTLIMRGDLDE